MRWRRFGGASAQKKADLLKKASGADPRIERTELLLAVLYGIIVAIGKHLREHEILPSLGWLLGFSLGIGFAVLFGACAFG